MKIPMLTFALALPLAVHCLASAQAAHLATGGASAAPGIGQGRTAGAADLPRQSPEARWRIGEPARATWTPDRRPPCRGRDGWPAGERATGAWLAAAESAAPSGKLGATDLSHGQQ